MPVNYVTEIQKINDHSRLLTMLGDLRAGRPIRGWARGKAFEHIVLRGFEIEGAEVRWPFEVRWNNRTIEQIDGAIHHNGLSCLVESKDYKSPIDIEAIAKLRNQLWRRPHGTLGLVFARSGYTVPAKELTRMIVPIQILLWECEELEACFSNQSLCQALQTKFKYAVEQGIPDYDTRTGLR